MSSTSDFTFKDTDRVTHEFVTPSSIFSTNVPLLSVRRASESQEDLHRQAAAAVLPETFSQGGSRCTA
jgi:hypothetical protein